MDNKIEKMQERFKNHRLTLEMDTEQLKMYLFRDPEYFNLWQRWILTKNKLIVLGDAFDAIYHSGAFTSLEAIAGCNIHYFNEKCTADKDGQKQECYDDKIAIQSIREMAISRYDDEEIFEENDTEEAKIEKITCHIQGKFDDAFWEMPGSFGDEYSCVEWLREHGEKVGGCDWWEGLKITGLTNIPYWHLAAIKEAVRQMKEQ